MDLSVIIPVYNGAATIGRCLDSIYSQGLDEKQFEVICVDDCSPDPSSVAAIENYRYQNAHPSNLILIKHDVNKRPGGARNTGIRAAKGDWIAFVDCDDFIVKDSLKKLLNVMSGYQDLELVHFCYQIGTETRIKEIRNVRNLPPQIMTGAEYHAKDLGPSQSTECLFKRSCFFTFKLWFIENIRYEDVDFVTKFNILVGKVLYAPIIVYYYVMHEGQTTDIGRDYDKIKELFLLSNRMAHVASDFLNQEKYKVNGEHLMHYAALSRILYAKRDLWKLGFKDRISVLLDVRLSYNTGYKTADFIYQHPIIVSILLIPMNKFFLNSLIKGKSMVNRILRK